MRPAAALARLGEQLSDAARIRYGSSPPVEFGAPRHFAFGDYVTNVAFALAKTARQAPQAIAETLLGDLRSKNEVAELISGADASSGFINLRLAPACWHAELAAILASGSEYGKGASRADRVSLEFGSANPTGPLVVVQGRTTSIGAVLANVLRFRGYRVTTEWITNDAGGQLDTLGRSLYARYRQLWEPAYAFPADGYPGDYLIAIAEQLRAADGERWRDAAEETWLPHVSWFARERIVAEQRTTIERFRVEFDRWQSERELHESGAIERGLAALRERGLTFTSDGALYLRTTAFGDDKDRVLVRSDGRPTYYATDVAYHYEKFGRSERVIDILGPDHHGYIGRLAALAPAFGFPGGIEVLISQQVTLMRGSEKISLSKRAGHILTLAEIIDEVGVDAARFFFVMISPESPLTFDLELAKQQNAENPVYYVQYGHTRIAALLRKADATEVADCTSADLSPLRHPAELALTRRLADLPLVAERVLENFAPHALTRYAREVAADFHQFYDQCNILGEAPDLRRARLALAIATQTVVRTALDLLGVTAPESM